MQKIKDFLFYNLPSEKSMSLLVQIGIIIGAGVITWYKTNDLLWTILVICIFLR